MKRILVALSVLPLMSGLCFAQGSLGTTSPAMKAAETGKAAMGSAMKAAVAFNGKIESLSVADPLKGTKSEIVVVDDSGKKMNFLVKLTTTIYDANLQPLTLDKVKADDKAMVKYEVNKEGLNEAQSISLVK